VQQWVKFLGAIPSHDMMDSKHPITYIYTSNVQTITVPYKTINNIQYTEYKKGIYTYNRYRC